MTTNSLQLVCPKTKMPLHRRSDAIVGKLNQLCRKKRLKAYSGTVVKGSLSAVWVRQDAEVFYVEREKMPILLADEYIEIHSLQDKDLKAEFK